MTDTESVYLPTEGCHMETIAICRDENCPKCGWPETYAEGPFDSGPTHIGCRKCGWREEL